MLPIQIVLLLLKSCVHTTLGDAKLIHNASELVDLSRDVNSGTRYTGTTVLLNADINFTEELSQSFEPIGKDFSSYFVGTFDGQGHSISNLKLESTSENIGLFGYSYGSTIRNVVIDDTCIVSNAYSNSKTNVCIAGVIGYCFAQNEACAVENNVNVANVIFNGKNKDISLHIGGIAGYIYTGSHGAAIRNCANYGSVTCSRETQTLYMGGIVGESSTGYSTTKNTVIHISNTLNYGTITYNSTATPGTLSIGGIAGKCSYNSFENCVNTGRIAFGNESKEIGWIVGALEHSNTTNCFWPSGIEYSGIGSGSPSVREETSQVILNSEVVEKLNTYSAKKQWNKWILNSDGKQVSFKFEDGNGFTTTSQAIILPDIAYNTSSEPIFSGWHTEDTLSEAFTKSAVSSETTLYSGWVIVVDLDTDGETTSPVSPSTMIAAWKGTYLKLPELARIGHTFNGWFTEREEGEKVESGSKATTLTRHTLYAHWSINNYTLRFDFDNGTEPDVRAVPFNSTIDYPKNLEKEGFTFNGWDKIVDYMPANDVNITALWTERASEYVEIVFEKKDISENDVREFIKSFAREEDYTIIKLSVDKDTEEVTVIIKFIDATTSSEFVRSVNSNKRDVWVIKRANGVVYEDSFSPSIPFEHALFFFFA